MLAVGPHVIQCRLHGVEVHLFTALKDGFPEEQELCDGGAELER